MESRPTERKRPETDVEKHVHELNRDTKEVPGRSEKNTPLQVHNCNFKVPDAKIGAPSRPATFGNFLVSRTRAAAFARSILSLSAQEGAQKEEKLCKV